MQRNDKTLQEDRDLRGDAGDFLVHNCYSSLAALIHIPVRNRPLSQVVMGSCRLQVLYLTNNPNINIFFFFFNIVTQTRQPLALLHCTLA